MNLEEAFSEIAEYMNIDLKELLKKYNEISKKYNGYNKWSHVTEEEFNQLNLNIIDSNQLMNFYSTTKNYIFELMEYHATEAKSKMRKHCVEIMKEHNIKTVLDFGCRIGQDSIEAAMAGLIPIACDVPGYTYDFAKWRFKKKNLPIKTIDITDEEPLTELYDTITCFEVVMHTTDPVSIIKHLHQHLVKDGLLFFTPRFKGYSLALKTHHKYEGIFDGVIRSIGFRCLYKEHMWGPLNEKGKYLYVYQIK